MVFVIGVENKDGVGEAARESALYTGEDSIEPEAMAAGVAEGTEVGAAVGTATATEEEESMEPNGV